jgi:hypothetical protein
MGSRSLAKGAGSCNWHGDIDESLMFMMHADHRRVPFLYAGSKPQRLLPYNYTFLSS